MYKQELSIKVNTKHDQDDLLAAFEFMLGGLTKTGQVFRHFEPPYLLEGKITAAVITPERTSLAKKYYSAYAARLREELEQWCDAKLSVKLIVRFDPGKQLTCTCDRPTHYVLFTHIFYEQSPVECGSCRRPVPLYRIAGLTPEEQQDSHSWQANYKACDGLQLNSTVGEDWATKQMSDVQSQLSKQGIKLCRRINEAAGIFAFYYLFNYRHITAAQDQARPCPSCGASWCLPQ